jgi:hypothetical protein
MRVFRGGSTDKAGVSACRHSKRSKAPNAFAQLGIAVRCLTVYGTGEFRETVARFSSSWFVLWTTIRFRRRLPMPNLATRKETNDEFR